VQESANDEILQEKVVIDSDLVRCTFLGRIEENLTDTGHEKIKKVFEQK
jgi:hypothetical protein